MAKRVRLFGAIEKVEPQEDGTLIVSGIASSETVDGAGEVVKAQAMRDAIPDYMKFGAVREMHANIAAGTALSINVDAEGVTHFEAHVVDPTSCKKVETNVLKGFSIGGKVTSRDPLNKKIIDGLSLTEISLVDVPCNPDAVFAMAKFDTEDDVDQPESTESTQKGMGHVADLAWMLKQISYLTADQISEAAREGDESSIPAKLKAWLAAGGAILAEMTQEEVAELVTALPDASGTGDGSADVAFAAGTGDLEKKLSASKVAALDDAHSQLTALHKSMGDCMGKMAGLWAAPQAEEDSKDGDDKENTAPVTDLQKSASEAVAKVGQLTEELVKVQSEKEALQKSLDSISASMKTTQDALAKAEADLKVKGVKQVVPVEKGKESTTLGAADQPNQSTDPLDVMKSVQGQPVNLIFNPR